MAISIDADFISRQGSFDVSQHIAKSKQYHD